MTGLLQSPVVASGWWLVASPVEANVVGNYSTKSKGQQIYENPTLYPTTHHAFSIGPERPPEYPQPVRIIGHAEFRHVLDGKRMAPLALEILEPVKRVGC